MICSGKCQPQFHCEIWPGLATKITYQPLAATILQGCSPVAVGGSYRLIRLWSPGLINSLAHSLFSASLRSQSISSDGQALEQISWFVGPK